MLVLSNIKLDPDECVSHKSYLPYSAIGRREIILAVSTREISKEDNGEAKEIT